MSSRPDSECGAYHLLSGIMCGRWVPSSRAQDSVPARSSVRFIEVNTSASGRTLADFFVLMLGRRQSSVASGLLLTVQQELTKN